MSVLHERARQPVKVAIRMSEEEELKALPILLRHSPGMMLRNGTYVVAADAARRLRQEGVRFTEPSREGGVRGPGRAGPGERT